MVHGVGREDDPPAVGRILPGNRRISNGRNELSHGPSHDNSIGIAGIQIPVSLHKTQTSHLAGASRFARWANPLEMVKTTILRN